MYGNSVGKKITNRREILEVVSEYYRQLYNSGTPLRQKEEDKQSTPVERRERMGEGRGGKKRRYQLSSCTRLEKH